MLCATDSQMLQMTLQMLQGSEASPPFRSHLVPPLMSKAVEANKDVEALRDVDALRYVAAL